MTSSGLTPLCSCSFSPSFLLPSKPCRPGATPLPLPSVREAIPCFELVEMKRRKARKTRFLSTRLQLSFFGQRLHAGDTFACRCIPSKFINNTSQPKAKHTKPNTHLNVEHTHPQPIASFNWLLLPDRHTGNKAKANEQTAAPETQQEQADLDSLFLFSPLSAAFIHTDTALLPF